MPYQQAPARRRGPFNNPFPSFLEVAAAALPQRGQVALGEDAMADTADAIASEIPTPAAPGNTPMQQDDGTNDETASMQEVAPLLGGEEAGDPQQINQRRALANAMIQRGQQPSQGGWLGGLARLTNSVGGSYMGMRANEEEEALKAKTSSAWQNILANSPDEQTLIANMMRSGVPEIRDRAVEAQLKSRLVKPTANGLKPGTLQKREENGVDVYERLADDGKTWTKVSSSPTYRPQVEGDKLSGYNNQEDFDNAIAMRGDLALAGKWSDARKGLPLGKAGQPFRAALDTYIANKMKERGMNAADVVLAMSDVDALREAVRTIQNRSTKIDLSAAEVDEFANYALGASKTIPRGDIKLVNGAMQWLRGQKSDANQAAFNMYNLALASAAAVVAGRGEVNQAMQEEFRQKLDTAAGPAAYAAAVKAVQTEARGMLKVGKHLLQQQRQMYANRQKEMGIEGGINTGKLDDGHGAPPAAAPAAEKPPTMVVDGEIWEINPATGKYRNTKKKAPGAR